MSYMYQELNRELQYSVIICVVTVLIK